MARKTHIASGKSPKSDEVTGVRHLLHLVCVELLSSKTKDYFDKQLVSGNISFGESFLDVPSFLCKAH